MNKICTSIEQSQKLIELGVDRKSSDMYYWCGSDLRIGGYRAQDEELDIPAWSLSALMNLLPEHVQVPPYLNQNEYRSNKNNGTIEFGDDYHTEKSTNFFDAVFKLIVWLKENGKI